MFSLWRCQRRSPCLRCQWAGHRKHDKLHGSKGGSVCLHPVEISQETWGIEQFRTINSNILLLSPLLPACVCVEPAAHPVSLEQSPAGWRCNGTWTVLGGSCPWCPYRPPWWPGPWSCLAFDIIQDKVCISDNHHCYNSVSLPYTYLKSYLQKEASKPLLKCQSVMEVKILVSVSSSKESIEMTFKWRVRRPSISNNLSISSAASFNEMKN